MALVHLSNGAIIPNHPPPQSKDASGFPIFLTWRGQLTLADITDGTSTTFLFGEKHIRPSSLRGLNEDRSVFGGNRISIRRFAGIAANGDVSPLRPPNDEVGTTPSFGGPHPGVFQFVFCDGSVKALKRSVDLKTLTALATRSGGEVLPTDY